MNHVWQLVCTFLSAAKKQKNGRKRAVAKRPIATSNAAIGSRAERDVSELQKQAVLLKEPSLFLTVSPRAALTNVEGMC